MTYTNQIMKTERMPFCCEVRGHIFSTGKTGGCSIWGIFLNIRRKLGFFMQNQLGNWLKTAKI